MCLFILMFLYHGYAKLKGTGLSSAAVSQVTADSRLVGEKVEGDGGANDFLHVAANYGYLHHDPEQQARRAGILTVAHLVGSNVLE